MKQWFFIFSDLGISRFYCSISELYKSFFWMQVSYSIFTQKKKNLLKFRKQFSTFGRGFKSRKFAENF